MRHCEEQRDEAILNASILTVIEIAIGIALYDRILVAQLSFVIALQAKQFPAVTSASLPGLTGQSSIKLTEIPFPAFPCTFLGGKKSTKRTAPRGLAFGYPRANVFFGAGRNSLAFGSLKQPARFIRKKHLRSAAPQRAVLLCSFVQAELSKDILTSGTCPLLAEDSIQYYLRSLYI